MCILNVVSSLLTCLYQLKSENVNLEDELASYTRRRDHLLAVNARLAIPLTPQSNYYLCLVNVILSANIDCIRHDIHITYINHLT